MRVLITTSTFPQRPDDGMPRFVLDLAEALAAHCEVTVLAPGTAGAPDAERWGDVSVRRFTYFLPRAWQRLAYGDGIDVNLRRSWLARLQPAPYVLAQARATRRLAARLGADLVNSHWLLPQGLSAALARGRRRGFAHVLSLHGGDAHVLGRLPGGRWLGRFVLDRSDAVFAASSGIRERLDATLGRPSGAQVQPVGVHLARLREGGSMPAGDAPFAEGFALYVGRLHEIKGVAQLLRAFVRVRGSHPGLGLLVVGYGEREAALRDQAQRLSLGEAVRFTGRKPSGYVAAALRRARVVVVPSIRLPDGREEGTPAVVLEALAAGARLVATTTGGIPDVLHHGENGWLCRDRDPEDLAEKMLAALAAEEDGRSQRVRASVARFDWPRVAERYLEVFERISAR